MLATVALILLATDAILRTVVAEEAVAAAEVESSQFQADVNEVPDIHSKRLS